MLSQLWSSYRALPRNELWDKDGGIEAPPFTSSPSFTRRCLTRFSPWPRSTIVLTTSNIVTVIFLVSLLKSGSTPSPAEIISTPSPALDAVQYLSPEHYDAAFRQTNRWRGPPGTHSNDVDIAWYEIELGAGGIRLTADEVRQLNVSSTPAHPLHKVPEEHGGGYLAMLEVFHLLHCLNSLRMGLFYNYEHYKFLDEGVPEENIITHFVDHCADMIRMSLMCSADVTPAVFYDPLEDPRRRDALPNWSSLHTCRNFDAILEWNKNGPRSVRWRDAGPNLAWDPSFPGAEEPF
ncbi:hypothetical protein B0H67DRAFT_534499 [Lasiosphaeris hirsuta]|uniref:Cyclochlorotine biosynthesis protein O n=1 Tax=Lasiosphaeris hirsuta TaxID=260670 RepID=A0AA40AQL2_9PEZI|nr:hypothetical protein B0H67DRAFT_534499 [Lasiosphaeris hirsuta]